VVLGPSLVLCCILFFSVVMGVPISSSSYARTMLGKAFVRASSFKDRSMIFQPTTGTHTRTIITRFTTRPISMTLIDPTTTTAAVCFFNGTQLPAILIAGLSLMGIFATSMNKNANSTHGLSKLQMFLLRLYHLSSLLSFCLSLSSIVTSTTATTLLLQSEFSMVSKNNMKAGIDVYDFLKSNLNFEFLYVQWASLVSIIVFIMSTTMRILLQFELFKSTRKLAFSSVVWTMTGFITFIIGYINSTQSSWTSFWGLTKEIFNIIWKCAYVKRQPMFIASLSSFAIGILSMIKFMMPSAAEHDQLVDHDRYT